VTLSRKDVESCFNIAISQLGYSQMYATKLKHTVDLARLSAALDKVDTAILELEGLRDEWRRGLGCG